ncbi:hypothetical protein FA09DRAFT_329293 [Tilletiopsis washingtonensis]|uniref:Uncharacterized protein n=1 Tax=Tilletiopsis washingtonensis TaxID=58919 RepID=A0A316ZEQ2_9BASI|nr:hypothetical protein FA09DRAFT_329293 [Tilletiopsis washingtonensis]PWN98795.1 hypothetical protein FA09DRAFT_329293 [Tilletiopsis washingtonensis]
MGLCSPGRLAMALLAASRRRAYARSLVSTTTPLRPHRLFEHPFHALAPRGPRLAPRANARSLPRPAMPNWSSSHDDVLAAGSLAASLQCNRRQLKPSRPAGHAARSSPSWQAS